MRTRHPLFDRKAARTEARAARAAFVGALAPAVRAGLQAALAEQVLPHLGAAGIMATYAAQGDEIDPELIGQRAKPLGWTLAYPQVTKGQPLCFHAAHRADLAPGALGIAEPGKDAPEVRPDVLLVPLLAVDLAGHRLGQGGGYYDRTLAALRSERQVLAIGLCWDMQLVDAIAAEAWDAPLDAVATPTAFHVPRRGTRTDT